MNLRVLAARLRGWLATRRLEREFDEEVAFHLTEEARDLRERGIRSEDADRAARHRFGNVAATRQVYRETGGMPALDALMHDLGYGLRMLVRQPGFTAVAVLSLALGIGVNTTVFTLIDASLLGSLPYPESGRLVRLWAVQDERPDDRTPWSALEYQTWRDGNRSFEAVGAMINSVFPRNVGAGLDGVPPERIITQGVSAGMWTVLGARPVIGRVFTEDEDRVGLPVTVIVLSYEYWQRRFAGDPDVLGRTIHLDNRPVTIIGVMPAGFGHEFFGPIEAWTPPAFTPSNVASNVRYLLLVARLSSGVSLQQAQADMDGLAAAFAQQHPERNRGWSIRVDDLQASLVGDLRGPLLILQGAVALVLLIACANVAGMLLARGASRQSEVALRNALGAGRWRIAAQLLMEGVPLAILGGAAGVGLAWLGLRVVPTLMPPTPALSDASLDASVLVFTSAVALLSVVVFGTVPAVQSSRPDLGRVLNESGRSRTDSVNRQRFRSALVVGQLALALVILTGAGLLLNSFVRLQTNDLGIDPSGVVAFDYQFSIEESMKPLGQFQGVGLWEVSPEIGQSFERVYERLKGVPGVRAVAAASRAPLAGSAMNMPFRIDGDLSGDGSPDAVPSAAYYGITPGFFATIGIPILQGRDFAETDRETTRPVAIVSRALADAYFPGENAIGRTLTLRFVPDEPAREIVGIVGDTRVSRFDRQPARVLYVPHLQHTPQWQGPAWFDRLRMVYLVRADGGDPMRLVSAVRRAVAEVDPMRPAATFQPVEQYLGDEIQDVRAQMILFGVFGVVALVLASVGVYGVMAYTVAQRTREIGIRMALGAPAAGVLTLVGGQALRIVLAGLAIGLAGAIALTRVIESTLWEVSTTDPLTFASVSGVLLISAVVACLLPVRRAVRVDPIEALRIT